MATAKISPLEEIIVPCPSKSRILICIDGSREAKNAFKFYTNVLRHDDDYVVLLHVSESVNVHSGVIFAKASMDEISEKMVSIRQTNLELENKYRKYAEENKLNFEMYTVSGEAGIGRTVLKAMKDHDISFVVVGSRGLGKMRRTVLGSVSHYILHHSDIPVFICPPKIPPAYYEISAEIQ